MGSHRVPHRRLLTVAAATALALGAAPAPPPLGCAAPARAQDVREEVKRGEEPQLTKPPKLLEFVSATYPADAQAAGIEGTVELVLVIDARGRVARVDVSRAPDPRLGEAAAAAARKFVFSPAELDGQPAAVQIRYSYNFVIERAFQPQLPEWMLERRPDEAQRLALAGQVREEGTRLPIPGAAVAVPGQGIEVRADERGRFGIRDLPAGKHRVEALALDAEREAVEVEISEGEQTKIDFYLRRARDETYETVVRGKRRQTTVTRVTLRQRQLTSVPGTFGDPVRVVENLPGLARIPYVGGGLLVRGASAGDSGVYLDGNRIPAIYHFFGGPSVLNPQFLERIDYYPGNADVRYGRLIAGVVDVATRDTFTEQLQGAVDINLLNASVFLNVPLSKRVSVAGAVRRSYIDAILPAVFDAAGQTATTVVPVYYDYQLRVDVKLAGEDRLFFLAFGSDDDLALASNEPQQDFAVDLSSKNTFHRFLGHWRAQWGQLTSRLQPVVGFNLIDVSAGEASGGLRTYLLGLRHDLELKASRRFTLRFGLDVDATYNEFYATTPLLPDYRNPAAPSILRPSATGNPLGGELQQVTIDQWRGGIGAYVDGIVNLSDKLQLIPGLRGELLLYAGHVRPAVDPRLTLRYGVLPRTTLKGAVGMFSQAPPLFLANPLAGNPDLQLEHAVHYSLGIEQQLLPSLSLDAQLYLIQRYDLGVRTQQVLFRDGLPRPLFFTNQGEGYSMGLELLLKHDVTRNFYGWLSYTLSRSIERRRAGGDFVRFGLDQTHLLTTVASYRFGRGWEAGARFRLVSGRPESPVLGGYFDSDGNFYDQIFGAERSTSRPLFHQLDLRLEKTWIFELWRFSAYLDVQNVYNAENPEATLWDFRFRESGPLRGLPILPSFGVKGSF